MEILKVFCACNHFPNDYKYRPTSKAVIFDDKNRIALMPGFPGGGVEGNETFEEALHRECMEELGMVVEITGEIGIIEQYRDAEKIHYFVHCFLARKVGELVSPTSTDENDIKSDFQSKLIWLPIEEAIVFTKMRVEKLEQGESVYSFDEKRKGDYFQTRIYSAKMVLLCLEKVKNTLL